MFQSLDGKFSKPAFDAFLRQNGLSEQSYITARRGEELRDQLTDPILAGVTVPTTMVDALHRYREETRVIEFLTVDPAKLVKVAEPDDAKLKEYYEANKRRFVVPEMKKSTVLLMPRAEVVKRVAVTDDEIKAAYETDKEKFNTPEKRRIQQITFPDKAAAEKAYETLSKAKDFPAEAAKLGFKESDFDLGCPDQARHDRQEDRRRRVRAEEGRVVQTDRGAIRDRARARHRNSRRASSARSTTSRPRSRTNSPAKRPRPRCNTLHDKVDDERSAGKTLKETATKFQLTLKDVAAIDRQGNGPDGKPVGDIVDAPRIALAAFGASAGTENDAIELERRRLRLARAARHHAGEAEAIRGRDGRGQDGSGSTQRSHANWARRSQSSSSARARARPSRRSRPRPAATAEKTNPVTRNTSPQGLSQPAVAQAFTLAKGAAASASSADNKSRTLIRVIDIITAPAATAEQSDKIKTELKRQLQSDTLNAYVGGLQTQLGVTVNEAAVRQALGQDRQTP